jgi:hypothetical protein
MNALSIFERLSPLHNDPEAFEKEAAMVRKEILESFPEDKRKRLDAMMWARDTRLSRIKNPMSRMEAAYALLVEDLQLFQKALNEII